MKKRISLLIASLGFAINGWANDDVKIYSHVILKLHDGAKYEIPIEHGSQIYSYAKGTGTNTYFVVDVTGKDCFYQFRREEIASMKMSGDEIVPVDIDTPKMENDVHVSKLHYRKGELLVHQTLEGEWFTITDMRGRQVYSARVEVPCILHLGFLPEGIYVAKVNEHTLKIRK